MIGNRRPSQETSLRKAIVFPKVVFVFYHRTFGDIETPTPSQMSSRRGFHPAFKARHKVNTPLSLSSNCFHTPSKMPVLSTLLHATAFKSPFLSTLVPSIGLAYAIQAAVAVPSIIAQSERFYDLSGSLTYLSCTALSLYLPTIRARYAAAAMGAVKPAWPSVLGALRGVQGAGLNWRQVALSAAVGLWATRCTHHYLPSPELQGIG